MYYQILDSLTKCWKRLTNKMSELQILSPDLLRTVSSYSSISDYFIDKIVSNHDNGFDFTIEQVFQLCDIEPQHCQDVFRTLQRSVENKSK